MICVYVSLNSKIVTYVWTIMYYSEYSDKGRLISHYNRTRLCINTCYPLVVLDIIKIDAFGYIYIYIYIYYILSY